MTTTVMRDIGDIGLTFDRLRAVNVRRCVSPDGFNHALASWSPAEWTNALCGEAGEAANIAKKIIRIRDGVAGNKEVDRDRYELVRRLAREVADTVIYADLALAREGFDLGETIREVFNAKSIEIGSPERL